MARYHNICDINSKPKPVALVVDDESIFRDIISLSLVGGGYSVILAEDGRMAVERVAEFKPDLVIMDVRMPVMDGLEATRRIRALDGQISRIPILGFSGLDAPEDRQNCFEAGMNNLVSKCGGVETLMAILKQYVTAPNQEGETKPS